MQFKKIFICGNYLNSITVVTVLYGTHMQAKDLQNSVLIYDCSLFALLENIVLLNKEFNLIL